MSHSDEILKGVKRRLLISYPFFGSALSELVLERSREVKRLFAQGSRILYNEEFVISAAPAEIAYWLSREILHLTMGHGDRKRKRSTVLWTIASEYCVNSILMQEGLAMGVQQKFFRRDFNGKSAEEVYAVLVRESREVSLQEAIALLDREIPEMSGVSGISGEATHGTERIAKNFGIDPSALSEIMGESARRSREYGNYRAKTLEMISRGRLAERTMGRRGYAVDLPVELRDNEEVPWQDILLDYAFNDRSGMSYRRFNRKYVADDIYLPQRYNMAENVVVAADVSASIPEAVLNSFLSDVVYLLQSRNVQTRVRLIQTDAEVQSDQILDLEMPEETILRRKGFGGTDFRPLFRLLSSEDNRDPLIVLTDGRGIIPECAPDDFDVIWISTDLRMPWGFNIQHGGAN